jgi:hypothetical protein
VQQFMQVSAKGKVPILLWHGGGLASVTWETTPDGRSGFDERRAGLVALGMAQ